MMIPARVIAVACLVGAVMLALFSLNQRDSITTPTLTGGTHVAR